MTSRGIVAHPADRKFAKFQLTGSPRALGAVYDLVAPELLKVALHLCGDPLDAEDLVQRTFLTAIERAQSFRRGERVLPWLLGILARHAREEQRRHGRVVDPLKLHLREELDPQGSAQEAELDEYIERALAALPEEQRSVLTLRLRHGLSAAQIADALGRPPGTVRSQLARGLEKLRSSLPAGVVSAALIGLGLSPGMEALRTQLLAKASTVAISKVAAAKGLCAWYLAPLVEIAVMKKLIAAGVVVLSSLAALQVATREDPLSPQDALVIGEADVELVAPILEPMEERSRSNAAAGSKVTQSSLALEAPQAVDAVVSTGSIRVRVRDSKGRPVEGAICKLRHGPDLSPAGGFVIASTDHAGEVLVPELPVGYVAVELLRGPSQPAVVRAGGTQLVEFKFPRGIQVLVSVVDELGDPVVGADIWFSERWQTKRGYSIGQTNGKGELLLEDVSPDNYIGAYAPGFGISYLQDPRARVGESTEVRIVLDTPGGSLNVEVVDGAGKALEGAEVFVGPDGVHAFTKLPDGHSGPAAPPRRGRTDEMGRALLTSVPAGDQEVLVRMEGFALGRRHVAILARAPNRLRVMLSAEARLFGRVLSTDGDPLKHVSLWTTERHSFASSQALTDKDGHYSMGGLLAGEHLLQAARTGEDGGAGDQLLVLSPGEQREVDLHLAFRPQIIGRLTDADGRELRGYTLVASGHARPGLSHTGVTDGRGRFTITVEEDDLLMLFVRRPRDWRSFPLLVVRDVLASSDLLELQLPDESELNTGLRLTAFYPDGEPAEGARLELWHKQLRVFRTYNPSEGVIEAQGIAPGTVTLTLRHPDHPAKALGEVDLAAGEMLELGDQFFEPSGSLLGNLIGVNDAELLATLAFHISRLGGGNGRISRTGTQFESKALQEGRHQISILGDFIKPVYRFVEITEGQELAIEVRLERAGLRRISVTGREGQEAPKWVAAQALDTQGRVAWSGAAQRQEDGSFELRISVEPGHYALEVNSSVDRTMSTSFDVLDWSGNQVPLKLAL